ncbi:MAG: aspartate aminotransferase family protein [Rhodospirillaceae bacterium]|nr:aspartate aminotransferase family protein [Rhodospirillaceae bacterium]|tara:strand:- start:624 stop:2000 length:1377 start_codon:yes stop_codon:yes gene_type:complete
MPDQMISNSQIISAYREKTPGSEKLSKEASSVLPSGIAHDSRYLKPYALYIEKAMGPHKWDIDGNRYVDYFGGHGALLLGHCHPEVTGAVQAALAAGTQFGANHPREVEWANQVIKMVPSVERIRFTSSGTEATLMALRLSRSFTGRNKFIRFKTHFHGWHDHMTAGYASHFDGSATVGVLDDIASNVILVSPQDIAEIQSVIASSDDIAAVIVEPTGSSFGMVPMNQEFLSAVREMTSKKNILLIFDEVVTGFRCAPGGAQEAYDITPDLTTMAKILAGGLPGGAVGGRTEIMDELDFEKTAELGREKIVHPGTFNANPVSATAGITALKIIEATDACEKANQSASWLRNRFNEILENADIPWAAYGTFSGVHIFTNKKGIPLKPSNFEASSVAFGDLKDKDSQVVTKLRLAMAVKGVDFNNSPGAQLSATHSQEDLEFTADAFAEALNMLRKDGEI